jgi:tetratricopeptide (TPR) repeat protein
VLADFIMKNMSKEQSEINCLNREFSQDLLWPIIHQSLEVFIRRGAAKAEPYELIWRLIHVWESVVVCLSTSVAAYANSRIDKSNFWKKCDKKIREQCYGVILNSSNEDSSIEKQGQGAFDGSINSWISILEYISTQSIDDDDLFLKNLINFLKSKKDIENEEEKTKLFIDFSRLCASLNRVCYFPFDNEAGRVEIVTSFKYVNFLRNKFAHTPFPYDMVDEVYKNFKAITEELFIASCHNGNPLHGSFIVGNNELHGSSFKTSSDATEVNNPEFIWKKDDKNAVKWDAKHFLYVDKMMRPYVLTRALYEQEQVEYTRYLAEADSLCINKDPIFFQAYPQPTPKEYANTQITEKSSEFSVGNNPQNQIKGIEKLLIKKASKDECITDNGQFIKKLLGDKNFDEAIKILEPLVIKNPSYHVNWERLGYAYREKTALIEDDSEKRGLIKKSIECFEKALGHFATGFKAEVYYQRSKSFVKLYQLDKNSKEPLGEAINDAQKALSLEYQEKYSTWMDYLRQLEFFI